MPSTRKLLHFLTSALLSTAGVAILGYGMSTNWATTTLDCSPTSFDIFNGSANLKIGLFNGTEFKFSCPWFDITGKSVDVFKRLERKGGPSVILHGLLVLLLALSLLGSAGSIVVTLYNSFSNPYETFMGPAALFTCSGFSACSTALALILYLVNIYPVQMFQTLVLAESDNVKLKHKKTEFDVGFFLLIPYICTNLLAILVVYLYIHTTFTRRRQQEKPTEDVPKDIMLF